jgi:hypothetical protein
MLANFVPEASVIQKALTLFINIRCKEQKNGKKPKKTPVVTGKGAKMRTPASNRKTVQILVAW